jgi:hypothetical protein
MCPEDDPYRHSTSVQSFYLCCHSVWADVPDCGWNCQLAVGVNGPILCSLAIIVGHLLDNDVADRCAGGPPNSICILSSDEWRVGTAHQNVHFGSKADIAFGPRHVRFTPESGHC